MKAIVSVNGEVRSVELPDDAVAPDHKHRVVDYFADPRPEPDTSTHAVVDFGNLVDFGEDGLPIRVKRTYVVRELTEDEKETRGLGLRIETIKATIDALEAGSLNARQAQQAVAHIARVVVKLWLSRS